MSTPPRRLWQIAGALTLAHVVLIPIGIALQAGPLFTDGAQGITDDYVGGDLTRAFTGGVLEAFGFLLFVPALVFLSRVLGRGSDAGAWAAQTGLLCGLAYVTVTFAVGFPAGAAAMYGVQHGLDVDAGFAMNNLRIFSYFLSLLLLGGSTLGFAVAALADRVHVRWFGWFGMVAGVALLASTPLAAVGQQDLGTLLYLVWLVGVGILLIRHRDDMLADAITEDLGSAPREAAIGHS